MRKGIRMQRAWLRARMCISKSYHNFLIQTNICHLHQLGFGILLFLSSKPIRLFQHRHHTPSSSSPNHRNRPFLLYHTFLLPQACGGPSVHFVYPASVVNPSLETESYVDVALSCVLLYFSLSWANFHVTWGLFPCQSWCHHSTFFSVFPLPILFDIPDQLQKKMDIHVNIRTIAKTQWYSSLLPIMILLAQESPNGWIRGTW